MDKLNLNTFVDRLVEEKKFPSNLDSEVMTQIKSDLLEKVEDRLNALMINNLPPEKLDEFNDLLDKDTSDEEMQKFFSDNIPDLGQLIASELIIFKQTYLS